MSSKSFATFDGRKEETTTPLPASTTIDHEVTQEDLDTNPDLVAQGVKVGDIIQIDKKDCVDAPESENPAETATPSTEEGASEETKS